VVWVVETKTSYDIFSLYELIISFPEHIHSLLTLLNLPDRVVAMTRAP
jgi:hypothetical protein